MYVGLHVKCRYCCQILNKLEFSRQIFEKYSNSNFIKIRPGGGEVSARGGGARTYSETDRQADRQTDMTKPNVALCNIANAPKNRDPSLHLLVFLIERYPC